MNTLHSTQEKRTIKVKDFLEDFRAGCTDAQLMERFHLTPAGLDKFYALLLERQIISFSDLQDRMQDDFVEEDAHADSTRERPRFYCPSCLSSQETLFDICPDCGFDLHDSGRARSVRGHHDPLGDSAAYGRGSGQGIVEMGKDTVDFPEAKASEHDRRPIEIPLKAPEDDDLFHHSDWDHDKEVFGGEAFEFKKISSSFDDNVDQVVPGMPLDYADPPARVQPRSAFQCLHCEDILETTVRQIFDRQATRLAFSIATVLLMAGLVGFFLLTALEGYSVLRLFVVYLTGMSMLVGCTLAAIGIFMRFLAREPVYLCRCCGRTYPRA
jgi:hypothetical protein